MSLVLEGIFPGYKTFFNINHSVNNQFNQSAIYDILTAGEIDDIRQAQYGWGNVAGIIKEYNSYFCPDSTTATKIATFIRNKFKYQDRNIKGVATLDAAGLLNGNVIALTNEELGVLSSLFQILNIFKRANDYEILAGAYSQDIFL